MKTKALKIFAIMIMAMCIVCTTTQVIFAGDKPDTSGIVDNIDGNITANTEAAGSLTALAGKIVGLVQIASAVAAVVLIAVFGFKFILGSAQEKSDYQKSFIPLIVGVVVVFAATSIAKLLFGLIG